MNDYLHENNIRIWGSQFNPLTNVICPGNRIRAGKNLFLCDTDMNAKWKIYRNIGDDSNIHWIIVKEGIDSQIELQSWFNRKFGEQKYNSNPGG